MDSDKFIAELWSEKILKTLETDSILKTMMPTKPIKLTWYKRLFNKINRILNRIIK